MTIEIINERNVPIQGIIILRIALMKIGQVTDAASKFSILEQQGQIETNASFGYSH